MNTKESKDRKRSFMKIPIHSSVEVTDEELAYFRDHPDEIDEFTAPVNIHKLFLWVGALLGAVLVGISKALKYGGLDDYLSEASSEFVIDIFFEAGVALIGAAVTAFILEILLNTQQENAAKWRKEVRHKISEGGGFRF